MTFDGLKAPASMELTGDVLENWKKFNRAFQIFYNAAEMGKWPEKRQINVFFNHIGTDASDLWFNKTIDHEQGEPTLKIVRQKFGEHFKKWHDSVLYNRMKFNKRSQSQNESFESFWEDICRMADCCSFPNYEEVIRDKIVSGIYNTDLQSKLFNLDDQSLGKIIDVCKKVEMNEKAKKLPQRNDENFEFWKKKMDLNQQNSNHYNDGNIRVIRDQNTRKRKSIADIFFGASNLSHQDLNNLELGESLLKRKKGEESGREESSPQESDKRVPLPTNSDEIIDEPRRSANAENRLNKSNINDLHMPKCNICFQSFQNLKGLKNHARVHTQKKLPCETCLKSFVYKKCFNDHKDKCRSKSDQIREPLAE